MHLSVTRKYQDQKPYGVSLEKRGIRYHNNFLFGGFNILYFGHENVLQNILISSDTKP